MSAAIAYLLTTRTKSMNNTSLLTVLGLVIASSQYAASNQIYPQYTSPVAAIATGIFGILAKGIDKR